MMGSVGVTIMMMMKAFLFLNHNCGTLICLQTFWRAVSVVNQLSHSHANSRVEMLAHILLVIRDVLFLLFLLRRNKRPLPPVEQI